MCVSMDDGEKVFQTIKTAFEKGQNVILSFQDVRDITSLFLNTAIGQLYDGTFSEDFIKLHISVEKGTADPNDLALLKRVVERAKRYYKDPKPYDDAIQEFIEE